MKKLWNDSNSILNIFKLPLSETACSKEGEAVDIHRRKSKIKDIGSVPKRSGMDS